MVSPDVLDYETLDLSERSSDGLAIVALLTSSASWIVTVAMMWFPSLTRNWGRGESGVAVLFMLGSSLTGCVAGLAASARGGRFRPLGIASFLVSATWIGFFVFSFNPC